jgi:hypothetical protein
MAKITFSAIVGDARKKIGGVVFSKSRTGAYVRRKVSPVQPRTTAQRAVRANFTANSKGWSGTLTAAERATFTQLAQSLTKKDRLGQSFQLTGAQLYQSISRNLHTIGVADLITAPANQVVSDLGGLTLAEVMSETSPLSGRGITVDPTNMPATGEYLVITAAAPLPAGRTFVGKGKYRIIQTVAPGTASPLFTLPIDVTAAYEAKFGALSTGQTIHMQINNISSVNGAAGKPYPAVITLT